MENDETVETLLEGYKWIEAIPYRKRLGLAAALKAAFEEGFNSYETPCCAYNSVEDAWDDYGPKDLYKRLKGKDDA